MTLRKYMAEKMFSHFLIGVALVFASPIIWYFIKVMMGIFR